MSDKITIPVHQGRPIKILQITDTHVFESAEAGFDGMNTTESLVAVIEQVKNKESGIDLVLVTGDLVQEPTQKAYLKLQKLLLELGQPVVCLAGNHDSPELMRRYLNHELISTSRRIVIGKWLIIMLNSFLEDKHAGRLSGAELAFLEQSLHDCVEEHVLIALHHHPVLINSLWMDAMTLQNPNEFFQLLDGCDKVRLVIWGHIHQEFRAKRNDLHLYGSPSTCIQFEPGADTYARDNLAPAYSLLELEESGQSLISVKRVAGF